MQILLHTFLVDRIGRFTTAHHILPIFVCKMAPTPPEPSSHSPSRADRYLHWHRGADSTSAWRLPSSLVAETAEVYGSGRGCSEWRTLVKFGAILTVGISNQSLRVPFHCPWKQSSRNIHLVMFKINAEKRFLPKVFLFITATTVVLQ